MRFLLMLVLALALALAGCARPDAPGASVDGTPASSPVPGAAQPAADATVAGASIRDGLYDPGRTTLAPGTTLTWTNEGAQTHSIVSDDGSFSGSGPVAPGASFSFTFQQPGEYRYHCRYHADMTGVVVVR